jgi:hypothetical protein
MKYIKPFELREIIFKSINSTIGIYRESKRNYFWFEYYPLATDCEVNDFIDSNPFFDSNLKNYLTNSFYSDKVTLITDKWYGEFWDKVYVWSESVEWLFYDVKFICDPYLNIEGNIKNENDVLGLMESLHKIKVRNFSANTY